MVWCRTHIVLHWLLIPLGLHTQTHTHRSVKTVLIDWHIQARRELQHMEKSLDNISCGSHPSLGHITGVSGRRRSDTEGRAPTACQTTFQETAGTPNYGSFWSSGCDVIIYSFVYVFVEDLNLSLCNLPLRNDFLILKKLLFARLQQNVILSISTRQTRLTISVLCLCIPNNAWA